METTKRQPPARRGDEGITEVVILPDPGWPTPESLAREGEPMPESVPLAYAGKWLAWSADGLKIVAVAETLKQVIAAAERAGEPDPIVELVPGPGRL